MRCPACGLENEGGRSFCVACAGELVPGAAALVEPPRARERTARRLRGAAGAPRLFWERLRAAWGDTVDAFRAVVPGRAGLARALLHLLFIAAAVVPGLAHLLLREWARGILLMGGFGAAAAMALLMMGDPLVLLPSAALFGLIFLSLLDMVCLDPATRERRFPGTFEIVIAAVLTLPVYGMIAALLNGFVPER